METNMIIYPKAQEDIEQLSKERSYLPKLIYDALGEIKKNSTEAQHLSDKTQRLSAYHYIAVKNECIIFYLKDENEENIISIVRILDFNRNITDALDLAERELPE